NQIVSFPGFDPTMKKEQDFLDKVTKKQVSEKVFSLWIDQNKILKLSLFDPSQKKVTHLTLDLQSDPGKIKCLNKSYDSLQALLQDLQCGKPFSSSDALHELQSTLHKLQEHFPLVRVSEMPQVQKEGEAGVIKGYFKRVPAGKEKGFVLVLDDKNPLKPTLKLYHF